MNPKVKEGREIGEMRMGEERNGDNWCKWQTGKEREHATTLSADTSEKVDRGYIL